MPQKQDILKQIGKQHSIIQDIKFNLAHVKGQASSKTTLIKLSQRRSVSRVTTRENNPILKCQQTEFCEIWGFTLQWIDPGYTDFYLTQI